MPGRGDGKLKRINAISKRSKDILFDVESEIIDIYKRTTTKEKKPGQSF